LDNRIWIYCGVNNPSAALVFLFIAKVGFYGLESGLVRSKTSINVAGKNVHRTLINFSCIIWHRWFCHYVWCSYAGLLGYRVISSSMILTHTLKLQLSFCFRWCFVVQPGNLSLWRVAEKNALFGYSSQTMCYYRVVDLSFCRAIGFGVRFSRRTSWLACSNWGFIWFCRLNSCCIVGGWVSLAAIASLLGQGLGVMKMGENRFRQQYPLASVVRFDLFGSAWIGFNGGSTLAWNDSVPLFYLTHLYQAWWWGAINSVLQSVL